MSLKFTKIFKKLIKINKNTQIDSNNLKLRFVSCTPLKTFQFFHSNLKLAIFFKFNKIGFLYQKYWENKQKIFKNPKNYQIPHFRTPSVLKTPPKSLKHSYKVNTSLPRDTHKSKSNFLMEFLLLFAPRWASQFDNHKITLFYPPEKKTNNLRCFKASIST